MKKNLMLLCFIVSNLTIYAQGIRFENSTEWDKIIEKAKKEKKYIFVDCFATWCGPCRQMDQEVFNSSIVGNFFKDNYISLRIQFDSTKNDNEQVKASFTLARRFEKEFGIRSYPTSLFFNSEGILVNKVMGAITPASGFLNKAKQMLDPQMQYFNLKREFEGGNRNAALIRQLLPEAVRLEDWPVAYAAHDEYVDLLDTPYQKEQLVAVYGSILNSNSKGFKLLVGNRKKIDSILNEGGRVDAVIKSYVKREVYESFIKGKTSIDWKNVLNYINSKAPMLNDIIMMELKMGDAYDNKRYEEFGKLKMDYYDHYAKSFDHNDKFWMNNELMDIFNKCFNKKTLLRAAVWSKTTIYRDPVRESSSAMDTYANLLYKSGQIDEAIKWQERACTLTGDDKERSARLKNTLEKMRAGIPTWEPAIKK